MSGRRLCAVGLVAVMAATLRAAGESAPASRPTTSTAGTGTAIITPTQGRPVFAEPGGKLPAAVQEPRSGAAPRFELVATDAPAYRCVLPVDRESGDERVAVYSLIVPADAPERTYDLRASYGGAEFGSRHSVAVRRIGRRIRLVHLSDMHIGDVGAPEFDSRLVPEVNLAGPALIVASGNLIDATNDDPARAWRQWSDFAAQFDAPMLVACGDHDDIAGYQRYAAPSPVGSVDIGPYRGVVLYDHASQPLATDREQIGWAQRELSGGDFKLAFVVSHDECPNLLRHWQLSGELADRLRTTRLGLWFSGGSRDWDGEEYRSLIDSARPLMYLRTNQSSAATRGGADGVPHYRVVDLDGERATLTGLAKGDGSVASMAVGRLRLAFEGPSDGSRQRVGWTVTNAWPFRLENLVVHAAVARDGADRPWCQGGRLERAAQVGEVWDCWVNVDVPDQGMSRGLLGTGAPPAESTLGVHFISPPELAFRNVRTVDGVTCQSLPGPVVMVQLQNTGSQPATTVPIVRLGGETIPYRVVEEAGPLASAYRLRLAPLQVLTLQADLSGVRVTAGQRELQAYLSGEVVQPAATLPVEVRVGG